MEEAETPPYWQPTAPMTRRNSRRRPILHSSLVIIIVPSLSLLFIVFILLPSIPRIIPQPNSPFKLNSKAVSVKKSWDTLNIVLVVFAILCGVFARLNDDVPTQEERSNGGASEETRRSKSERRSAGSTPQWGGYEEQRIFNSPPSASVTGVSRLRRTVSEMPPSQWTAGNDRLRFHDDFDINTSYQIHPNQALHHYHHHYPSSYPELNQIEPETNRIEPSVTFTEPEIVPEDDGGSVKEIPVETFVRQERADLPPPTLSPPRVSSSHAPPTPPPTPPPPPPLPPRPARTFQNIPSKTRVPQAPPPHPPPPPPRPPPSPAAWGEKKRRSSRKKMNATKEIATAIASLYNTHRKRKRKQKSYKQNSNYEEEDPSSLVAETPPSPTPPPPPPPPPPSASVFHSLFRKGGNKTKIKSKKVHSLTSSIPEPPPPPRPVNSSRKPPLPSRSIPILFEREEGFPKSGSQSPATPIPPPPPPPTRLRRHDPMHKKGTREPEVDGSRSRESSSMATACPSPDVNAKADTFIARLHDGWRLEKLNSWREKRTVTDAVVAGGPQYEGLSN